ncbi:MAG: class I SAM-dependent methyltransferase [Sedimentisphaerales bacterium]
MENYERYKNITADSYEKKRIMYYLCQIPSDKKILDVGCGSGLYTKFLIKKNKVVGIDQNPHLCRLSIPLHKGDATQLSKIIGDEKFDMVFSTWMTKYLNPEQLSAFLSEAEKVLNKQGIFISTFISNYCLGCAYIKFAKQLKNVDKHRYSKKQISELIDRVGFRNIEIININSRLNIPWAYLATAEKI